MNNSNAEGLVTLSRSKASLVYDINEKSLFSPLGFKKMQNTAPEGFIKCNKTSINGKIRLTYDVSRYVTLQEAMSGIYSKQYLVLVYNMLSTVIALREYEFMHRENISLDPRGVFVDLQTFKAYFIYLPIERESSPGAHIIFEKRVRNLLSDFVRRNPEGMSTLAMQVCRDLTNFQVNTQEIIRKLQTESMMTATAEVTQKTSGFPSAPKPSNTSGMSGKINTVPPMQNAPVKDVTDKPCAEKPKTEVRSAPPIYKKREPQSAEKEINDLLKDMSKKSYNSTNPNNMKMVEKTVKKEKKKMKKETAKMLIFFGCYFPILFAAMFIIFNYYRNSGMSGGFVVMVVAVLMVVLMAPVIFFTRKPKKDEETTYVPYVPASRMGFKPYVLVSVSNAATMEFFVNKEEYLLGKMTGSVDAVIPFDKTVSDIHCRVIWDNGYFIEDFNSDYGTYVDEIRVVPGQRFPLKNGNRIKISKNVFEVRMF